MLRLSVIIPSIVTMLSYAALSDVGVTQKAHNSKSGTPREDKASQYRAVYLYRIVGNMSWPKGAFTDAPKLLAPIVVGFIGDGTDAVRRAFEQGLTKVDDRGTRVPRLIAGRKVVIKKLMIVQGTPIPQPKNAAERTANAQLEAQRIAFTKDLEACHELYVGNIQPTQWRRIHAVVSKRAIVTIGEDPNFTRLFGMFRFLTVNKRLRMEVNRRPLREAGLKPSAQLLQWTLRMKN